MSDLHLNFGAHPHERPDDDDAREARHQVLATLLGAYADRELPPETTSQIDAHLLGCARCRREVEMHTSVRERLSHEPVTPASAALRERIMLGIANAQPIDPSSVPGAAPAPAWWQRTGSRLAVGAALLLGVLLFTLDRARDRGLPATSPITSVATGSVPLLTQVLDDYRRVASADLPGRARDLDAVRASVPFPVQPLFGDSLRLLAAWSTDLEGEPAAVLAYRWRNQLVLEYLVAETTFFRHASLRAPIGAGQLVAASSGSQRMLAWAAPRSGVVLVGDIPQTELAALRVGGAGR